MDLILKIIKYLTNYILEKNIKFPQVIELLET